MKWSEETNHLLLLILVQVAAQETLSVSWVFICMVRHLVVAVVVVVYDCSHRFHCRSSPIVISRRKNKNTPETRDACISSPPFPVLVSVRCCPAAHCWWGRGHHGFRTSRLTHWRGLSRQGDFWRSNTSDTRRVGRPPESPLTTRR